MSDEARAACNQALTECPAAMSLRNADGWQQAVDANPDPYGRRVIVFAEEWARLMEGALRCGDTIPNCAERLCRVADYDGITGFMYGCAVSILAQVWEHGEALRVWHNLDTQIGDEGERANREGGTLNPAILNIGGKP